MIGNANNLNKFQNFNNMNRINENEQESNIKGERNSDNISEETISHTTHQSKKYKSFTKRLNAKRRK
jgi:hypothetical protein